MTLCKPTLGRETVTPPRRDAHGRRRNRKGKADRNIGDRKMKTHPIFLSSIFGKVLVKSVNLPDTTRGLFPEESPDFGGNDCRGDSRNGSGQFLRLKRCLAEDDDRPVPIVANRGGPSAPIFAAFPLPRHIRRLTYIQTAAVLVNYRVSMTRGLPTTCPPLTRGGINFGARSPRRRGGSAHSVGRPAARAFRTYSEVQ